MRDEGVAVGVVEAEGEDVPGEEGLVIGGAEEEGRDLVRGEAEVFGDGQVFEPCELDLGGGGD